MTRLLYLAAEHLRARAAANIETNCETNEAKECARGHSTSISAKCRLNVAGWGARKTGRRRVAEPQCRAGETRHLSIHRGGDGFGRDRGLHGQAKICAAADTTGCLLPKTLTQQRSRVFTAP